MWLRQAALSDTRSSGFSAKSLEPFRKVAPAPDREIHMTSVYLNTRGAAGKSNQ